MKKLALSIVALAVISASSLTSSAQSSKALSIDRMTPSPNGTFGGTIPRPQAK